MSDFICGGLSALGWVDYNRCREALGVKKIDTPVGAGCGGASTVGVPKDAVEQEGKVSDAQGETPFLDGYESVDIKDVADADGGSFCIEGMEKTSYSGLPGTEGIGICQPNKWLCKDGKYKLIQIEVLPHDEICNGLNDDCDEKTDEDGVCHVADIYEIKDVYETLDIKDISFPKEVGEVEEVEEVADAKDVYDVPEAKDVFCQGENNITIKPSFYYLTPPISYDLNNDGEKEIIALSPCPSNPLNIYVFNKNGENLEGWPKLLNNKSWNYVYDNEFHLYAVGNIDDDPEGEIVVIDHGYETTKTTIYAYNHDGSLLENWPVEYPKSISGGMLNLVQLGDLTGDGKDEIILSSYEKEVVFNENAYEMTAFSIDSWSCGGNSALGDIDNDGILEIIAPSYYKLNAWNIDGSQPTGFPIEMKESSLCYASGTTWKKTGLPLVFIADLDKDGNLDIVTQSYSNINIYNNDGSLKASWALPEICGLSAGMGDLDSDGQLDLVFVHSCDTSEPDSPEAYYAYTWQGNALPGWPIVLKTENMLAENGIAVVSMDSDPEEEILVNVRRKFKPAGQSLTLLRVYNHDGSLLSEVDYNPGGYFIANPLLLSDLEGDKVPDLIITTNKYLGEGDKLFAKISFPCAPSLPEKYWPMMGHDPGRTWNYETPIE